jgi:host factor-I protein
MKEDSQTAPRPTEALPNEDYSNRKLIRPTLTRPDGPPPERRERPAGGRGKPAPPEQTHAENFYYQKQMQAHTPLVVVLKDGEQVHGTIEWYDRDCLKLTRTDGKPNLLLYKDSIKYLYKHEGGNGKA